MSNAARCRRKSKGEWSRQALENTLKQRGRGTRTSWDRLAALNAPTAGIDQMLAEIEAGRK